VPTLTPVAGATTAPKPTVARAAGATSNPVSNPVVNRATAAAPNRTAGRPAAAAPPVDEDPAFPPEWGSPDEKTEL
jgi:hypothetical protein